MKCKRIFVDVGYIRKGKVEFIDFCSEIPGEWKRECRCEEGVSGHSVPGNTGGFRISWGRVMATHGGQAIFRWKNGEKIFLLRMPFFQEDGNGGGNTCSQGIAPWLDMGRCLYTNVLKIFDFIKNAPCKSRALSVSLPGMHVYTLQEEKSDVRWNRFLRVNCTRLCNKPEQ